MSRDTVLQPLEVITQNANGTSRQFLRLAEIPPRLLNSILHAAQLVVIEYGSAGHSTEALADLSRLLERTWSQHGGVPEVLSSSTDLPGRMER